MTDSKSHAVLLSQSRSSEGVDLPEVTKSEKKYSGGVPVEVSIQVFRINNIDAVQQNFFADFKVWFRWTDPKLIGTDPDSVEWSNQWSPNWYIVNALELSSSDEDMRLKDKETGLVTASVRYQGLLTQFFRLKHFPFDSQNIRIDIGSRSNMGKVQFVTHTSKESTISKFHNAEWQFDGFRAKFTSTDPDHSPTGAIYSQVHYKIKMLRYAGYYVWNIALPTFMLVCLSFFVSGVDLADFGTRMSITLTIILTTVAFKLAIGTTLPKVSYFTLMDFYVFGANVFVYVMALLNWISVRLKKWTDDENVDDQRVDDFLLYGWLIAWGSFNILFTLYSLYVQKKVEDKDKE